MSSRNGWAEGAATKGQAPALQGHSRRNRRRGPVRARGSDQSFGVWRRHGGFGRPEGVGIGHCVSRALGGVLSEPSGILESGESRGYPVKVFPQVSLWRNVPHPGQCSS
eukprot:gene13134-biopygen6098